MSLIEELLSQKNEQIHQQMRDLKAQHDAVERAILSIERYRKSPVTGTFSLEYIDRRYVWGVPCADNFYSDDIHSYERLLRDLRLRLEDKGFQQIHSYNIGTSIAQGDFEEERFVAGRIFIFTSRRDQDDAAAYQVVESGHVRLRLPGQLRRGGPLRQAAAGLLPEKQLPHRRGLHL